MQMSAKSSPPHIFDRGPYLARGDTFQQPKLILGTIFGNQILSWGPFLATKIGPPGQILGGTTFVMTSLPVDVYSVQNQCLDDQKDRCLAKGSMFSNRSMFSERIDVQQSIDVQRRDRRLAIDRCLANSPLEGVVARREYSSAYSNISMQFMFPGPLGRSEAHPGRSRVTPISKYM